MLKNLALLASVGTVAGHASYMIESGRCDRDMSVGATIMGATATASPHTIAMAESFPPQVSLPGASGEVLFEASVGTFAAGPQTGCGGTRSWVRAGQSVAFNLPADASSYTIRAVHADAHGAVSVAEMVVGGSSCSEDINGDAVVDVNDLLSMLSGFGGDGSDGADVNGDAVVDVNDLLQLLSAFGSECSSGAAPAPEECSGCCPVGAACFAPDPPCCADRAPTCTMGAECGGQVWNDCGTSCPAICGQPPAMMCNMMCNAAYQCPNALMWDGVTGECVNPDACTEHFVLPPGMALGRPFMTVAKAPSTASPVEVLSDWFVEL